MRCWRSPPCSSTWMPTARCGAARRTAFTSSPSRAARLDPASLSVTGIDPHHPLRPALPERDALQRVFREIRHAVRDYGCRRAILVGHNAAFDLGFLNAAVARADVKRNPFHPFSCFDTATLAGRRARADGAGQGGDGGGPGVGLGQRALRPLRCRAHRGAVLPDLQPPARQLCARRGARARARLGEQRRPRPEPSRRSEPTAAASLSRRPLADGADLGQQLLQLPAAVHLAARCRSRRPARR